MLADLENALTMFDCIGACKFMGILLPAEDYVELINAATGWSLDVTEFRRSGERIYNLMRAFNVREGVSRADDALPPRLMEDPLPGGPAQGQVMDLETVELMKDAYYRVRGWDLASGKPTPATMERLGLEGLVKEVRPGR